MKRHERLQPLSRQHHNGLLAALLLKKGVAKKANQEIMSDFILNFWKKDLKDHFNSEEKYLLPALAGSGFDKNLNERLLEEHATLRGYIHAIEQLPPASIQQIEEFYQLLEQHIRFEERTYFPTAERALSEEQLRDIGEKLNDEGENCMNYPIKFWE